MSDELPSLRHEILKLREEARIRAGTDVAGEQARRERAFARGEEFAYTTMLNSLMLREVIERDLEDSA